MTATSFYRRAAFLPVLCPVLAAGIVALSGVSTIPTSVKRGVDDVAGFVALAGVAGLIPYALWGVIVLAWTRPETEADNRRLSWLAPICIAVPFGLGVALATTGSRPARDAIGSFATWGMLALAVGYFYTVTANVALSVAKRVRCVE